MLKKNIQTNAFEKAVRAPQSQDDSTTATAQRYEFNMCLNGKMENVWMCTCDSALKNGGSTHCTQRRCGDAFQIPLLTFPSAGSFDGKMEASSL